MHERLETVVLTVDKPEAGLRAGDIGAVLEAHASGVPTRWNSWRLRGAPKLFGP